LRVTELARRIFRDDEFARQYLNLPDPVLNNQIPMKWPRPMPARGRQYALLRFANGDIV
jgi:hypothetical protein